MFAMLFLHQPNGPRASVLDLDRYHTATRLSLRERRMWPRSSSCAETWRFQDIEIASQSVRFWSQRGGLIRICLRDKPDLFFHLEELGFLNAIHIWLEGAILMKAARRHLAIISVAIIIGACAAPGFKATHDYDDSVNFSGYQAFAWISEHPMKVGATREPLSPLL